MRYSPSAGKHTEHTVERVKKRRASELSGVREGSEKLLRDTEVSQDQSLLVKKPTKRVNLIYRCTETGKAHSPAGKRAKKFELIDK